MLGFQVVRALSGPRSRSDSEQGCANRGHNLQLMSGYQGGPRKVQNISKVGQAPPAGRHLKLSRSPTAGRVFKASRSPPAGPVKWWSGLYYSGSSHRLATLPTYVPCTSAAKLVCMGAQHATAIRQEAQPYGEACLVSQAYMNMTGIAVMRCQLVRSWP